MAVAVVRHAGARHVVATDLNPTRRELAQRLGATLTLDPRERDLGDVQRELGMTEGFDVMLEMSGNADALRSGIANMAHGGRIAILGIPTAAVELDLDPVIFNMLTLRGIYGREMFETWYQMSVLVDSGLDISPVITHRFPYSGFEEAFQVAASGDSGKVLLDWKGAAS
jgi:threonine 3-dehydrogenase